MHYTLYRANADVGYIIVLSGSDPEHERIACHRLNIIKRYSITILDFPHVYLTNRSLHDSGTSPRVNYSRRNKTGISAAYELMINVATFVIFALCSDRLIESGVASSTWWKVIQLSGHLTAQCQHSTLRLSTLRHTHWVISSALETDKAVTSPCVAF